MTQEVVTRRTTDDLERAKMLMARHQKSRIMCVDEMGRLVGVNQSPRASRTPEGRVARGMRCVGAHHGHERCTPGAMMDMDIEVGQPVTWERVITFARRLEASARRNGVTQEDGSRLVRLLLQFDRTILGHDPRSSAGSVRRT